MTRLDYILWNRQWMIKLVAAYQMTVSSFFILLYTYLLMLQNQLNQKETRKNVIILKWLVLGMLILDFAFGSLLAFAANLVKKKLRTPMILSWIFYDVFSIPLRYYFIMALFDVIATSTQVLTTDSHFLLATFVEFLYVTTHFVLIILVIEFLAYFKPNITRYDPSKRPISVHGPTDPQITTTESRHIRFSDSFLQMPSKSRILIQERFKSDNEYGASSSSAERCFTAAESTDASLDRSLSRHKKVSKDLSSHDLIHNQDFETNPRSSHHIKWSNGRSDLLISSDQHLSVIQEVPKTPGENETESDDEK